MSLFVLFHIVFMAITVIGLTIMVYGIFTEKYEMIFYGWLLIVVALFIFWVYQPSF